MDLIIVFDATEISEQPLSTVCLDATFDFEYYDSQ